MSSLESLPELQSRLREFARERDWEQFHTPKNMAMALVVEAAELVELFQWLTPEASAQLDDDALSEAAQEIADVQIYLARLADILGIDILKACDAKLAINREKYPVEQVKGSARKYTHYADR